MLTYLLRQVDDLILPKRIEFLNVVLVMKLWMNFIIFFNVLMYVYQIQGLYISQTISYQIQMF